MAQALVKTSGIRLDWTWSDGELVLLVAASTSRGDRGRWRFRWTASDIWSLFRESLGERRRLTELDASERVLVAAELAHRVLPTICAESTPGVRLVRP